MHVSSLHFYPIKGCRGQSVEQLRFDELGAIDDRRLMLVDANNRFVSQRELPALATVAPVLDASRLTVYVADGATRTFDLTATGDERRVTVWGSTMRAIDQGDEAGHWFSDALGSSLRLVRWGRTSERHLDPAYSPRADAQTAFTDGYPALLTLEASLADLNTRLAEPVPMARFRPNIVVAGGEAWAEDHWNAVAVGSLTFDAVKPCARCVVTTTDQRSGSRHPNQEPLRTLAAFRTIPRLGAIFGENLVHRGPGVVAVGDELVAM
jgi:uncharacterized protein YcbX